MGNWATQLVYFLGKGYRVIALDRRGHGRSAQVSDGHDMDHYAAGVGAVIEHLDLRNAVHIGHSTGDGEATHNVARHGQDPKLIDVPTLVMHGDDDQIVPIADSALLSAKLLNKGTLKIYEKFPHGMCTTQADTVNPDLLAFIAG